jgi:glucokinase
MSAGSLLRDRLVADVGGTNTRLALYHAASREITDLRVYRNREFPGLESIIDAWLQDHPAQRPADFCIAVAAPPADDLIRMSNIDWAFSCSDLAQRFGFGRVRWLNDFEANAHALPHLGETGRVSLYPGAARDGGTLAVMGPGTGLGGATLERVNDQFRATTCEPGHMGLSPATEEELALFARLLPDYGEIHVERLVSGPGILLLYRTLAELRGDAPVLASPDKVSRAALADRDELALAALRTFCALLGSACGDFILANGAYGGLYLAGGILPGMLDFLRESSFHQRFCDKGAMQRHLQAVPVYGIIEPQPGLVGAAHAPV